MIKSALVLFVFTLMPFTGWGKDQSIPSDVQEKLHEIHDSIQTVSGSFVQEKHLDVFDQTLVSSGSFAIDRPGRIRWAYEEPSVFGFSSDGLQVRRWSEESGMSQTAPLARDPVLSVIVDQMLAWSTMDLQAMEDYFSLTLVESEPMVLELEPEAKELRDIISKVLISFDSTSAHIEKIRILEHDSDKTCIRFKEVSLNQDLDHELF